MRVCNVIVFEGDGQIAHDGHRVWLRLKAALSRFIVFTKLLAIALLYGLRTCVVRGFSPISVANVRVRVSLRCIPSRYR